MAKTSGQKQRLLMLRRIFLEQTGPDHPLTMPELLARLEAAGITAERKALYDDIEVLRQAGLDISLERGRGYFLASREFELPELKLLVDAVQSAKFITAKKSGELIKKLESLTSRREAGQLRRQVFVYNRVKTPNERIYYNVDALHGAIAQNRRVAFKYMDYGIDKQLHFRRGGAAYKTSPVALSWDDENYYLVAYSAKYDSLTHYRVDKMSDIEILEQEREPGAEKRFDVAQYAKKMFGMFSGEEQWVEIEFSNTLIGVVIDRFGQDVRISPLDENHFKASVKVAVSKVFLGWLFQFGEEARPLSPGPLVAEMRRQARSILARYDDQFDAGAPDKNGNIE